LGRPRIRGTEVTLDRFEQDRKDLPIHKKLTALTRKSRATYRVGFAAAGPGSRLATGVVIDERLSQPGNTLLGFEPPCVSQTRCDNWRSARRWESIVRRSLQDAVRKKAQLLDTRRL